MNPFYLRIVLVMAPVLTSLSSKSQCSAQIVYQNGPFCKLQGGIIAVSLTGTTGGTFASTNGTLVLDPVSGVIDLAATPAGQYSVIYSIAPGGSCPGLQVSTTLNIYDPTTWMGKNGIDWHDPANWCGGIPDATTDITIPPPGSVPTISGVASFRNIGGYPFQMLAGSVVNIYGSIVPYCGNICGLGVPEGVVYFKGSSIQQFGGIVAKDMIIDGAGVRLLGSATVENELRLLNGNLLLSGGNLALKQSADGSMNSHIIPLLNGSVTLVGVSAGSSWNVPIGISAANYNPVKLKANAGHVPDHFTISVKPGVFLNGVSGFTRNSHVVNRTWTISETNPGGSDLDLEFQWNSNEELPQFDRTASYVMQYISSGWQAQAPTPAQGTGPFQQSYKNVTSVSSFSVASDTIAAEPFSIYPNPSSRELNIVLYMAESTSIQIDVFDSRGSLVISRPGTASAGLTKFPLNIERLSEGYYLLRVSTGGKLLMNRKFVKSGL